MKTSESIKTIAKALLQAQKAMGGASKDAANPYFKSKYADYGSVLEACKDLFNSNGILILQPHLSRDGKNFVLTTLVHAETGEFIESETEVVCAKTNDPQALGSAITYARRYGLQSILAMPAEDDDGEKAMGRTANTGYTKTASAATVAPTTATKAAPAVTVTKASTDATPAPAAPVKKMTSFKDKVAAKKTAAPASNGSDSGGLG